SHPISTPSPYTTLFRSSFVDSQSSLGKERLDQLRFLTQPSHSEVELLVQLFQVQAHHVAHLHVLEVVPPSLIPRVQVRRVSRQRSEEHTSELQSRENLV